jgi:hypothetical protein
MEVASLDKKLIQKTSVLLVIPSGSVTMNSIYQLNDMLASENCDPFKTLMSKNQLTQLVSNSPFCQIVEDLSNQSICLFFEKDSKLLIDDIMAWLRTLPIGSRAEMHNLLICRKEHLIRVPIFKPS